MPGRGNRFGRSFRALPISYDEEVRAWSIGDEAFYRGPIEFPTYVMLCEKFPKSTKLPVEEARKGCWSGIQLTDTTFFYYSFPRALFWEHEKFQERIRQKLINFTDESQREQVKEQAYDYLQGLE